MTTTVRVIVLVLLALLTAAQRQCASSSATECGRSTFRELPNGTCKPFPQMTAENRDFKPRPYIGSHMGGVNASAPFTASMRCQSEQDREKVRDVAKWFEENLKAVEEEKKKHNDCNLRNHQWTEKAKSAMKHRKLGLLDIACTTLRRHTVPEGRLAFKLFRDAADAYRRAGMALAQREGWTSTKSLNSWVYSSKADQQRCTIQRATGIKRNKKWYIQAQVTNAQVESLQEDKKRWFLEEWIPQDFCCPLTLWWRDFNQSTEKWFGEPKGYSTIFATWEGAADVSALYDMQYEENRPLNRAIASNALAVDQAKDAIRPSNVAILALPLAMSFIPVALIADVNDFAAFIYVIFTDFFSAVPFVIKGIELVYTGTDTKLNGETWVVGDGDFFVSESWVASCEPRPEFKTRGILFISIGVATILTGFALEHLARKYMRRRIELGEDPRPLGEALFSASHPLIPRNYSDHLDTPNFAADLPAPPPPASAPFSALYRRFIRRRLVFFGNRTSSTVPVTPTLGTGAGLGAAVMSAAPRGPSPRQVSRWSDERWYEYEHEA